MDSVLDIEFSTSREFVPRIRPLYMDESDLVVRAQNGDIEAFEKLVDIYKGMVLSIGYQIAGNGDDAQDICQESFIKLNKNIRKYTQTHRFSTWLYRLVANTAIDYLRKERKRRGVRLEPDMPEPNRTFDHDLRLSLEQILVKLSPKQRIAFVLRDLQGFPLDEVATILRCTGVTVRVHLHNARTRIRKNLENEI